jgi:hypothetical protein
MQAVKIGSATDYKARMASLQTGCPLPLDFLWLRATPNAHTAEKALHNYFASFRIRGEWFDLGHNPVTAIEVAYREISPAVTASVVGSGKIIQDVIDILGKFPDKDFIPGLWLARELIKNPAYKERSALGMTQFVAASLLPVKPRQVRFGKKVIRGYYANDIRTLR